MVAISLYRGNLHRVPDVPRRWLMPTPEISLKDFRVLLNRRSRALASLCFAATATATAAVAVAVASTSNHNPKQEGVANGRDESQTLQLDTPKVETKPEESGEELKGRSGGGDAEEVGKDLKGLEGADHSETPVDKLDAAADSTPPSAPESAPCPMDAHGDLKEEKSAPLANPHPEPETSNKEDAPSEKEKRKKEVEEKLIILNEKKHNLVQVLKQILQAEEELKRRNNVQGVANLPSIPLHVDTTNDYVSATRNSTPRGGSEGSPGGDMERGETDDVSNHNLNSCHLLRTSSASPTSESLQRRPPFNAVPHPSRTSLASAGSPSRFAPTGHQGHPANLPAVSVSGTSYIGSSPSPAGSGGTSAFRESRLPSPWN